jgi:hypothetical protein
VSPNSLQNMPACKVLRKSPNLTLKTKVCNFSQFFFPQCEESKNLKTNPGPASLPSDSFLVAKFF